MINGFSLGLSGDTGLSKNHLDWTNAESQMKWTVVRMSSPLCNMFLIKYLLSLSKQDKMKEKVSHGFFLVSRPGSKASTPSDKQTKTPINSLFFAAAWETVWVFTYLLFLFCCILLVDHIHTLSKYRNPPSPFDPSQASSSLLQRRTF